MMLQTKQIDNYPVSKILEIINFIFPHNNIAFPYDFKLDTKYIRNYLNENYVMTECYSLNSLNRAFDFYNKSNIDGIQKTFIEEFIAANFSHLIIYNDKTLKIFNLIKSNKQLYSIVKNRSSYYTRELSIIFVYAILDNDKSLFYDILNIYKFSTVQDEFLDFVYDSFGDIHLFNHKVDDKLYEQFNDIFLLLEKHIPQFNYKIACDKSDFVQEIYNIRIDLQENIPKIIKLLKYIEKNIVWDDSKKFPPIIIIDFKFPNGKSGDIFMYFTKQYGEVVQTSAIEYKSYIKPKFKNEIIPLLNYRTKDITISEDVLNLFYPYTINYIPLKSHYIFNLQIYKSIQQRLSIYYNKNTNYINTLYAKLKMQGDSSPRWKSEFQLYTIALKFYPDAIYQYHTDWLGAKSLDIYIPSIRTGIEYQGQQHFQSVEYFGGKDSFEYTKERDKEKRELCKQNNISLIEWLYTESINEEAFRKVLNIT